MTRIAKIVIGVWLVITVLFAVPAAITQIRGSVSTGSLVRSVEPRILFGSGRSNVQIEFAPESTACPVIPLSIMLLIDKSGSMDAGTFQQAREAATAFINSVDLSQSSVAVAFFDSSPYLVQSITQEKAALLSAIDRAPFPDGGTDFTGALQLATDNIGPGRPVVVLLTDGGANDPVGAMAVGNALKSAGVYLVTVAVGPSAAVDYLRDLASSPSAALVSNDPTDLQSIYTDLAGQLSNVVATNATFIEPVSERFVIDPDSTDPPAAQNGQDLIWQAGFVPSTGSTFRYDVATKGIGWPQVTSEKTTMSFIDCQAGLASLSLGAGPRVLVLPGPTFWIPWLLALLLPVFLLLRGKRPPPIPSPSGPVVPPPTTNPDPTPAWLRRLDSPEKIIGIADIESESGALGPTIIVGLGPVGRIVLSQVAQALNGRFVRREQLPVRLLQVDVQPMNGPVPKRPDYLLPDEWVILRPDYPAISQTLQTRPQDWLHMDWYEPTAAVDYGRARGRMALFYDLRNGTGNSTLFKGLRNAAADLDKPRLRVVGSTFDDVSSGMLVDISWLMWLATKDHVDVELWLSGPLNSDWSPRLDNATSTIPRDEQHTRTLATLREIERFQRNARVPLHYVPREMGQMEFYREVDSAVVQTLFLFEAPDDNTSVEDHLSTLTDSMVALLNPSVQKEVADHLTRFQADAFDLVNRGGVGLVCGTGAYAISTPLVALREALNWRLVHDLICEARTGLLPSRRLKSNGEYDPENPDRMPGNTVSRVDIETFVENHRAQLHHDQFRQAAAAQVANILNGEGNTTPAIARSGGIRRARKWVEMLRIVLKQEGEESVAVPLDELIRELNEWDSFLHKDLTEAAAERLRVAREKLEDLIKQGGRSWSIDDKLEWPIYKEHIRSWLDRPSTAQAGDALVRAGQRFGWQTLYNPTARAWEIELWIPDGKFIWAGQPISSGQLAVPRDAAATLDRLYELALPLVYNAGSYSDVLRRAAAMDSAEWLGKAEPRLAVNELRVAREMRGAENVHSFLAARETDKSQQIRERLEGTGDAGIVTACAIEDKTTVTLLRVRDRVPMNTTYIYDDDRDGVNAWHQNPVLPSHYVWRGEQIAAEHESGARLGSRFVGFLERDAKLVDLYARAVAFGLFVQHPDEVVLAGVDGWAWPGETAGEALINLFDVDSTQRPPALSEDDDVIRAEAFRAVEEAIAKNIDSIRSSPGLAAFRREAERTLKQQPRSRTEMESIQPWQRSYEEYYHPFAEDDTPEGADLRLFMLKILSTLR